MGFAMPRAKRSIESALLIDGILLNWRLHREQQWFTADGWMGVVIHVKMAEGAHRELFLEYPAVRTHKSGDTRIDSVRQNISPTRVEAHIHQAMAAGWDPRSRGKKPFVYQVAELPG
jgi:hypothetical protein